MRGVDHGASAHVDPNVAEAGEEDQIAGSETAPSDGPPVAPLRARVVRKRDAHVPVDPPREARAVEACTRRGPAPPVAGPHGAPGQPDDVVGPPELDAPQPDAVAPLGGRALRRRLDGAAHHEHAENAGEETERPHPERKPSPTGPPAGPAGSISLAATMLVLALTRLRQAAAELLPRCSRRVCGSCSQRDGRSAARCAPAAPRTRANPPARGGGPRVSGASARGGRARRPPEGLQSPGEVHIGRLLRMHAGLEEAIIRLEARGDGNVDRLISRLRLVQDDIATALRRLEDPGSSASRPG